QRRPVNEENVQRQAAPQRPDQPVGARSAVFEHQGNFLVYAQTFRVLDGRINGRQRISLRQDGGVAVPQGPLRLEQAFRVLPLKARQLERLVDFEESQEQKGRRQ